MPLDPDQVALVRESFAVVKPVYDRTAGLFYDRLFSIAPDVRTLFPEDLGPQRKKLVQALNLAVASLDRPEDILVPVLHEMGARHVDYGVEESHYPLVADALMWTIREGLGDGFTPEVEAAWTATVTLFVDAMVEGARSASSRVA